MDFYDSECDDNGEQVYTGLQIADSEISNFNLGSAAKGSRPDPYAYAIEASPEFRPTRGRLPYRTTIDQAGFTRAAINPNINFNMDDTEEDGMHYDEDEEEEDEEDETEADAWEAGDDDGGSDDAWEVDAVTIDARELPAHPPEPHQDAAECLDRLARTVRQNTQTCLDSARQHAPAYAAATRAAFGVLIMQPCARLLGGSVLEERGAAAVDGLRALVNHHFRCDGWRGAGEVAALRERLVEQDMLLRDSQRHIGKLRAERERLRGMLEGRGGPSPPLTSSGPGGDGGRQPDQPGSTAQRETNDGNDGQVEHREEATTPTVCAMGGADTALADQLRELRFLVDQMTLQEVAGDSSPERQQTRSKEEAEGFEHDARGIASNEDDAEGGWDVVY